MFLNFYWTCIDIKTTFIDKTSIVQRNVCDTGKKSIFKYLFEEDVSQIPNV